MNKEERLKAIRAKCVELLAIAEKRTPGDWQWVGHSWSDDSVYCGDQRIVGASIRDEATESNQHKLESEMDGNTTFIAACAGTAEAGWRATIAAIDAIERIQNNPGATTSIESTCGMSIELILSAWEGVV